MATRSTVDFPTFFQAITGQQPFEWQAELADQLVAGHIPDVIDVPTGFGKTSVIHCWAYALAERSDQVPRRLCFVVDRRLVVDAAYEGAEHLCARLADSDGQDAPSVVAERLRSLHGDAHEAPLRAVRMRGGVTWDSRWLARPDQAAVIVGTVDQFGSRLLFRGYGVSPGMRPIDAALVGTDAWLVVDEAHIAEALTRTARSVASYQGLVEGGEIVAPPLRVSQMSATVDGDARVFRPDLERQRNSVRFPESARAAAMRLDARKPARLVDLPALDSGSAKRRRELAERFGRELAVLARQVDSSAVVVGVIANTIATARAAHVDLVEAGEESCLLIGRCREFERAEILTEYGRRLRVGAKRSPGDRRLYVVATQTIEVGADFDLDAIVTECAPLSSLVQRFGRVNRVGARAAVDSCIVHAGFFHGAGNDPVYGPATHNTWEFLQRRYTSEGRLDFGIPSTRALLAAAKAESAGTESEAPFVPTVLGAHIERWAATRPVPFPDQDVAPFLHGVDRAVPEVSVAWRVAPRTVGASLDDQREAWQEWLDLVRPVEWEFVSIPIWEARALIADTPSALATSDLATAVAPLATEDGSERTLASGGTVGVVYRGPGEASELTVIQGPADISVGDRIVLDSAIGGHDRWGWTGRRADPGEVVPDIADLAPSRAASVIRIDEAGRVLGSLALDPERGRQVQESLAAAVALVLRASEGEDAEDELDLTGLEAVLRDLLAGDLLAPPARDLLERAVDEQWRLRRAEVASEPGRIEPVILLEQRFSQITPMDAIADDDDGASSSAPLPQSLEAHSVEVRDLARRFTESLGVPEPVARTVALAAHFHDLGKADDRFQAMLYDGDAVAARLGEQRAKSGRDWRDPIARRAGRIAGVPRGFRHEAVSGRLVRSLMAEHPELADGVDPELLHHLVVSHHGHARPLLPAIDDVGVPSVNVTLRNVDGLGEEALLEFSAKGDRHQVDWSHPARFERLNDRYGWWGLAFLEALVRLADLECSARLGRGLPEVPR
jgi:CRISPR-associated endonuclease/helicase Cas3